METYLNKPEVKSALGVPQERGFASCNMQVNQAFMFNGDGTSISAFRDLSLT